MRRTRLLIFGMSLLTALLVVVALRYLLPTTTRQAPPLRPVVTAKVRLEPGTKLRTEMLEIRQWPEDLIPRGAFSEKGQCVDRIVFAVVDAGEALTESKFFKHDEKRVILTSLEPGWRAVYLPAEEKHAPVSAGAYVDLWAFEGQSDKRQARLLLEDCLVLDVIKKQNTDEVEALVLKVQAERATDIYNALARGPLRVSLRAESDHSRVATTPPERPARPPRPTARPRVAQVAAQEEKPRQSIRIMEPGVDKPRLVFIP